MRPALRAAGELLLTSGVVVLLFVFYTLYVTDWLNAGVQRRLHTVLAQQWAAPGPSVAPADVEPAGDSAVERPALGSGIAVLRIPRLGRGFDPVVVEGVSTADLDAGPGHYPGSAMPGGDGNFVVSGHRTTHGAPFNRLDEVRTGDSVVVETRDSWFVYRETREVVVLPTAIEVVSSVPPGESAGKLLTFTTCNPKLSATQRLVLRGVLVEADAKTDQPAGWVPTALAAGAAADLDAALPPIPASAPVVPRIPDARTVVGDS